MPAVPWTTVTDSGRSKRPPPAHPLWRRAMPAVPWTTVTDSLRGERPTLAHPLWCREYAMPAVLGRPSRIAAV
eukprot:7397303-Pyramimonas_sp.AAC.1